MTTVPGTVQLQRPYDLTFAEHDYPAWDGAPRRTVLICTHPRSGSTLLGEALYFAGGLGCPLEYLHRGFRPTLAARWQTPILADYVRAMRRVRTDTNGTLSIKLFWNDIETIAGEVDPTRFVTLTTMAPEEVTPATYREVAALLSDILPNADFIHLQRLDRVRQAVSGLAATQTGLFRVIPEMGAQPAKGEADYDFDRIDQLVAYSDRCHAHWRNFFAAIGAEPLRITYEELARDYAATVAQVLAHLGSDAPVPSVRMKKQSTEQNEGFVLRYLRDRRLRAD